MKKELYLSLPKDVVEATKLPPQDCERELYKELAIALYARDILSFGKARSLAKMIRWEFEEILGQRKIERHYDEVDLDEDIRYAQGNQ